MSVWKQVKSDVLSKNVNERLLIEALKDLGIGLDNSVKSIRNNYGSSSCDAALTKDGKVTSMGIKWVNNKGVELVGDTFKCNFGFVNDKGQETLMNKLSQAYQIRHIKQQMQYNNWTVESQTNMNNNKVKLVLTQM